MFSIAPRQPKRDLYTINPQKLVNLDLNEDFEHNKRQFQNLIRPPYDCPLCIEIQINLENTVGNFKGS